MEKKETCQECKNGEVRRCALLEQTVEPDFKCRLFVRRAEEPAPGWHRSLYEDD